MSQTIPPDQALWLLGAFCRLHRQPFDAQAVQRECVPPLRLDDLVRLAEQLGLQVAVGTTQLSMRQLAQGAILRRPRPEALSPNANDADSSGSDSPKSDSARPGDQQLHREVAYEWLIVVPTANDSSDDGIALQRFGESLASASTIEALNASNPDIVLLVRPQPATAADPDAVKSERRFGFGWFVPELLKHRRIWREVLLASLVLQLIALAFPLFTQAIIDKVVVHRTQSTLIALAVGMAVFILFTALLTWVRQYLVLHTGNRVDAVLGSHVFEHLFRLPPLYFQHRPTGIIAARLQGIETIREFVSSAAVTLMLDLPFLLIFVAVMFWYSVPLTLIVLAILAVIVASSLLIAPLWQRRLNEQFLRGAANQAFVTEYVAGLETVKSLQLEPQINRRYRDLLAAFLSASMRTRQLGNTYGTLANSLEQVMSLAILTVGAYIVMTTGFTVGMLVAFQMFASRLSQPMLRLVGLWQQFQQARIAVVRLGDVMNAPAEPYRLTQVRASSGAGLIAIDNLAFQYAQNLPSLYDGFSFTAQPGQLVAIMGPSGAGKSTLAKLLQAFYQPTAGSIRIDGVDIRYLAANELRSYFGIVPQETTLFSGTILDNLQLAQPHASFEQIVAACRMAEIHSTIEALPNGYQTPIGERGAGLSGGQRQRIAIARALLKGPKILIFDEATSSVDAPTAEQLGRTISALKGKVTILFIAHALPKTLQPDQVLRIGEKLAVVPISRTAGDSNSNPLPWSPGEGEGGGHSR